MRRKNSCCYECEDRWVKESGDTCHADCEAYQEEVKENEER